MPDLSIIVLALITITQILFLFCAGSYQARCEEMDTLLSEAGQAVRQLHRLQAAYERLLESETRNTFSVN